MWVKTGKLLINLNQIVMVEECKLEDGEHLRLWSNFQYGPLEDSTYTLSKKSSAQVKKWLDSPDGEGFQAQEMVAPVDDL
jgi:hypothetical protein